MFDPTDAVSALCQLTPDKLNEIQGIKTLRSLLQQKVSEDLKFNQTILQRLKELQGFCEARDAPAIVGEKPALDFRLIDIRFVDGKSRTQDLQANIRRVMGERSLASEYVAANPERLTNASEDDDTRGKRNSGTIRSYVTQRFPHEVQDVAQKAIRNGFKLLVLEDKSLLPIDTQHGLIGLVAIAHRHFERSKVKELSKHLKSQALAEALQLAVSIGPLFSEAFEVYTSQAEEHQTPREQNLNSSDDSISSKAASDVASIQTQEGQTTRKRARQGTPERPRPPPVSRKTKSMRTNSVASEVTYVETPPVHSSSSHHQVPENFADGDPNTRPSVRYVIMRDQEVHQSPYAQECTHSVQEDGSMAAPITQLDLLPANKPDQAKVRETDAETYQQESHQSFNNASLQNEQVPSLLHSGRWTPQLCSQEASGFAGCHDTMPLLPVFDVALDPSTYAASTLDFDINSVNDILPLYNLDTVTSPLQFQFPSFAPLQS